MSALDPSLCCKQTCPVAQRVIQESVYVTRSDILARVREQLINTLARMPAGRRLVVCVPSPTCGSMQWVYVELCHLLPANHLLVCSDNYAPRALPVNTDVLILDDYVLSGHHMLACIEDLLSRERSAHSLTVWIVAAWGTNDSIVSLTEHLVTKPIHQRSGPIHLKLAYPVHPQLKKIAIDKTCACLACEKGSIQTTRCPMHARHFTRCIKPCAVNRKTVRFYSTWRAAGKNYLRHMRRVCTAETTRVVFLSNVNSSHLQCESSSTLQCCCE
jgi:hypothetical protein